MNKKLLVGDVTNIRRNIDFDSRMNQRLHQWCFGKFFHMLEYKARLHGMEVEQVDESYTSQTCPSCGNKNKPSGREYSCSCGFEEHRDVLGAINIRLKHLDEVSGKRCSPETDGPNGVPHRGIKYDSNMRCSSTSGNKTCTGKRDEVEKESHEL